LKRLVDHKVQIKDDDGGFVLGTSCPPEYIDKVLDLLACSEAGRAAGLVLGDLTLDETDHPTAFSAVCWFSFLPYQKAEQRIYSIR
jgi:hypothetical protein